MRLQIRLPQVLVAVAAAAFGSVGIALYTQHGLGMLPCPWCVLQRLIFVVIGLLALLAALGPRALRLPLVVLADGLAAAGLAAAMWQQFHASKEPSCDMTLADRIVSGLKLDALLPDVFMALASCADATVDMLGISYAVWSGAMFVLLGLALGWAVAFLLRSRP